MAGVTSLSRREKFTYETGNGEWNDADVRDVPEAMFPQQVAGVPPTRSVPVALSYPTNRSHRSLGTPAPSYRTIMGQSADGSRGHPPAFGSRPVDLESDNPAVHTGTTTIDAREMSGGDSGNTTAIWPPLTVIHEDRGKATAVWLLLLTAFIGYVIYLSLSSIDSRKNPPVQIKRKEEPFSLPDVVFCPSSGDGCDSDEVRDCLPMHWAMSSLGGLLDCDDYFVVPPTLAPTPSPTPPPTPSPSQVLASSEITSTFAPGLSAVTPSPVAWLGAPSPGGDSDDSSSFASDITSGSSSYASSATSTPSDPDTPSPVALPAIHVNLETTAQEWCPRVPLSECNIDYDKIESGHLRSLHASFYVMWKDVVASDPVESTRRFINMFFVDVDKNVTDAVVAARLPYDRVTINGNEAFNFASNDVVLRMSQYVHLDADGDTGMTERTFTQATTTAEHTLRLEAFEGRKYEGALLYVTLNVNDFAFQSVEEVDPVDWWALLGAVGGVWEIVCVMFGVFFVASQASGPDKKWSWKKAMGGGKETKVARSRWPTCCRRHCRHSCCKE